MSKKRKNNKHRKKRQHTKKSSAPSSSAKRITALVPLDTHHVRKKWIAACKHARTTFLKAQQELDRFEQEEKPAYRTWLHSNLGVELSTVRELQQKLETKDNFYQRLRAEAQLSGKPYHICYDRLQRGESVLEAYEHANTEQETRAGNDDFYEDAEEDDDWMGEEFDDFFKQIHELFERLGEMRNEATFEQVNAADSDTEHTSFLDKLKRTYRQLCQRLHPDADGENKAEDVELWHETQEAYQNSDIERLELILAKSDLKQGTMGTSTPVSRIADVTEDFREARMAVRDVIKRTKNNDPAWGFFKMADTDKQELLEAERHNLEETEAALRCDIEDLDDFFAELEEMRSRTTTATGPEADTSTASSTGTTSSHTDAGRTQKQKKRQSTRKKKPENPNQMTFDFT